jgi:hypothetical protein
LPTAQTRRRDALASVRIAIKRRENEQNKNMQKLRGGEGCKEIPNIQVGKR